MFGQRKRLRHVAVHMLLVWVFALASGIVNACIVAPDLRHAEMAPSVSVDPVMAMHGHVGAAMAHHDPGPTVNKAPCAKFCADESTSAPVVKLLVDPSTALCLATAPTLALAAQAALVAMPVSSAPVAPVNARIPIPIAYLRLTL